MNKKTCPICKSAGEFFKNKSRPDGLSSYCKSCHSKDVRKRAQANPIPERARCAKWRNANRSLAYELTKKWSKANPGKKNALIAKRRAAKLQATPAWLSEEDKYRIQCFYVAAQFFTKLWGVPIEVDHIVPLQGKEVRGLHVPWNLQFLTASDNARKRHF